MTRNEAFKIKAECCRNIDSCGCCIYEGNKCKEFMDIFIRTPEMVLDKSINYYFNNKEKEMINISGKIKIHGEEFYLISKEEYKRLKQTQGGEISERLKINVIKPIYRGEMFVSSIEIDFMKEINNYDMPDLKQFRPGDIVTLRKEIKE